MDIILNINKPKDITSQGAVSKVKKILKVKKAGHTGTLDPMATGLMLICINKATRLASYFSDQDKEYRAVIKLGETTDTQDAYGKIISRSADLDIDKKLIEETLQSFKGKILQQPPMFSALKHNGEPLYKLARKGIEIERKTREINIYEIELLKIELPYVHIRVLCSKGTYIRTLSNDIGEKLGTGAHLTELERTAVGPFNIDSSLTFDDLSRISKGDAITRGIYTMDEAMSWLPEFNLKETQLKAAIHGNPIKLNRGTKINEEMRQAKGIRVKSPDGSLLAIGSYRDIKHEIKMDVVFV